MKRSKLETCIDILKVLAKGGPLKLTHVMSKANVNCNVLKEYLDFLTKQGLVEGKIIRRKKIVYPDFVINEVGKPWPEIEAITYKIANKLGLTRGTTQSGETVFLIKKTLGLS